MTSWWDDANLWVSTHQALVGVAAIPLTTAAVAAIISFLSGRATLEANKRDRAMQREMKLAEFRQEWMKSLLSDMAEFLALTSVTDFPAFENKREYLLYSSRIKLALEMRGIDIKEFSWNLSVAGSPTPEEIGHVQFALRKWMADALKSEWSHLEDDMKTIG